MDLDHILTATSESGSSTTIGKKDFKGFSVIVVVPEPSSFLLPASGLAALAVGGRRRRAQ